MSTSIIPAILVVATANAMASTVHSHELDVVAPGHATLTVVVTTRHADAERVTEQIDIPVGMTVTGMTLERTHATAMPARAASDTFDEIVRVMRDPALLEYAGDHRAQLSVFPVRAGAPAKIVIELTATSLVRAQGLPGLAADRSLLAREPFRVEPPDDPYADYWPEHDD
jgi:hypothetical protein